MFFSNTLKKLISSFNPEIFNHKKEMSNKPSFLPEEGFSPDSPSSRHQNQSRVIPERCKSQFVSLEYSISKEQPSLPLEIEELPNLSEFLSPNEISLLCESQQSDLNEQTSKIVDSLSKSEINNYIIATKLEEFSNEIATNIQYLENAPEFQPNYLNIQETRGSINVSRKFFDIPNEKIFSEIPKMFA
ncbi:hypothetical protein TRFO_14396 [Tritrichomonas foetus]|uniref:Uncharacterized protein n=1 Tax=Tritrichomonas foetus TaxID=1144522 RepID=A0A1J4KV57_9EUKA|nr:hypothetical protein TRFO_14396 [Tritrichomonas foetus]|eukprot:OHT15201.1 hypothetical protein TRFO_14396 [Tritrichomonas foetus]